MYGKVINFDIGSFNLRAVFAKISFRSISIDKNIIIKRHPEESIKALLERFHGMYETEGYTPILLLPSERIQYRILSFPFRSHKEIRAVLKPELEEVLPNAEDEIISDFFIITDNSRKKEKTGNDSEEEENVEVLSASVRKDFFAKYLEPWIELQLVPGFVGLESVAARALNQFNTGNLSEENNLVLDLGYKKTLLTIISGGSIRYIRVIPIGSIDFNEIVLQEGGIDSDRVDDIRITLGNLLWEGVSSNATSPQKKKEEKLLKQIGIPQGALRRIHQKSVILLKELLREIQLSIFSQIRQKSKNSEEEEGHFLQNLYFLGGFSNQEGIQEIIAGSLSIRIKSFIMDESSKQVIEGEGDFKDLFSVHGLLLSIAYSAKNNINFLQDEFASLSITRRGSSFKVPIILGLVAIVLFLGNLSFRVSLKEKEEKSLETELIGRIKKNFPGMTIGNNPIRSVRSELLRLEKNLGGVSIPGFKNFKLIEILKSISSALAEIQNFKLKNLKFEADRVTIKGFVPTFGSADEIKKKLEETKIFKNVDDPKIRKDIAKDALALSISAKVEEIKR